MAINIDAIKSKLAKQQKGGDSKKMTFFKPKIGEYEIRFLPYQDSEGQPFQSIRYYNKLTPFGERRIIAPSTFGLPDPVVPIFEKLRKEKDNWFVAKNLQAQEKVYALLIDRAAEELGPQVWEMAAEVRDEVYKIFVHKDNVDEDMTSPDSGYDFTLTVSQKQNDGKPVTFKGQPVKSYSFQARKKSSKLSSAKAKADGWLAAIPNLEEYFKAQLMSVEDIELKVQTFIDDLIAQTENSGDAQPGINNSVAEKNTATRGPSQTQAEKTTFDSVSKMFEDSSEEGSEASSDE